MILWTSPVVHKYDPNPCKGMAGSGACGRAYKDMLCTKQEDLVTCADCKREMKGGAQ